MNRCRRCGTMLRFHLITLRRGWRRWDWCATCGMYWWMDDNFLVGNSLQQPPMDKEQR